MRKKKQRATLQALATDHRLVRIMAAQEGRSITDIISDMVAEYAEKHHHAGDMVEYTVVDESGDGWLYHAASPKAAAEKHRRYVCDKRDPPRYVHVDGETYAIDGHCATRVKK